MNVPPADPNAVPTTGVTKLPPIPPAIAEPTVKTSPAIAAKSPFVGSTVGALVVVHLLLPPNSTGTL